MLSIFQIVGVLAIVFEVLSQYAILPTATQFPDATVGIPYERVLGISPSTISLSQVIFSSIYPLPEGLLFQSNGVINGTPALAGNYSILIQAQIPSALTQIIANYSLAIKSLQIANSSLPKLKLGVPFSITLISLGGILPLTWSYLDLPVWTTTNGSTLSGLPSTFGTFPFSVSVIDAKGNTASHKFSFIVETPETSFMIVTPSSITVTANVLYTQTLVPSGGFPPYVMQFPNKPSWMNSSLNLVKIFIPTLGRFFFTVQIVDSRGTSQFVNVTVNSVNEQAGLIDFINKSTTNIVDPKSGVKVTIFNTSEMNNGDLVDVPQRNITRPRTRTTEVRPEAYTNQVSYIKDARAYNPNRSPCQLQPNTVSSLGIIRSINFLESRMTLNDNRVLQFQNCTKQAFRSNATSFKPGDSVTFAGNPKSQNEWYLYSISNLS